LLEQHESSIQLPRVFPAKAYDEDAKFTSDKETVKEKKNRDKKKQRKEVLS
jgi:hypothetical protein